MTTHRTITLSQRQLATKRVITSRPQRESEHAAHMAIMASPSQKPRGTAALPALTIVPQR